jgi:hypothetical protein
MMKKETMMEKELEELLFKLIELTGQSLEYGMDCPTLKTKIEDIKNQIITNNRKLKISEII